MAPSTVELLKFTEPKFGYAPVGDSMITSTLALLATSVWLVVFVQPWVLSVSFSA